MAIQIGGGIFIGGGIGFDTGAPVAGGGSTYPTISAANEAFKFDMNTLAASPDFVADTSLNAWSGGGSGGYASLTQPLGGAYSDGGYYYRNDGTNNNAWIAAINSSSYATYHNANIAQASWALETNIWLEDVVSYNINTNITLLNLYNGGITISQQSGSSTTYRIFVNFATAIDSGSSNGIQAACNNLTGGAWKHLVIQYVRSGAGTGRLYCFVDGVLQNSGGTINSTGSDFWCSSTTAHLGETFTFSAPKLGFRLDNTRLIQGASFPLTGFTAPTAAFTA
jgi:hypothetical protein